MTECAYLKDELGPVLAKGLAAVAAARPEDPTEYLALWLLHYLQKKERKVVEVEATNKLESEREQWAVGRALREKSATTTIQREWRAHVHAQEEAKLKEARLRQVFASVEETLEEKVPEEQPAEGEKPEAERAAEHERLAAQTSFGRSRLFVAEIDKSYIADLKAIPSTNRSAMLVLRSCFYLMGMRPRQVDTWDKVRALIKPYPFSQWLTTFNPIGTPLEKKRKITRARRLLTLVSDEEIKGESAALHAISQWLGNAVTLRETRDEHVKIKKAAGKDAEEELDEEEEAEDEEKDVDEDAVKRKELEAQRAAESERAIHGEGEGENPEGEA